MNDPYLVLGLTEAEKEKAGEAFEALTRRLSALEVPVESKASEQAAAALTAARQAKATIDNGSASLEKLVVGEGLSARLRLGQLCLASHMISLEQLQEAVAAQSESDKQLGEILQDMHFISQEELDGLLIGQDLIVGDEEVKDPQALRLLAMGLISEELAVLGLLETRLTGETFNQVLNRRGWLSKDVSDAIFGSSAG